MTWVQFYAWWAYYSVEPFGEDMAEIRAGVVASTIANVYRDPKTRKKPFTALDFVTSRKLRGTSTKEKVKPADAKTWSAIKAAALRAAKADEEAEAALKAAREDRAAEVRVRRARRQREREERQQKY